MSIRRTGSTAVTRVRVRRSPGRSARLAIAHNPTSDHFRFVADRRALPVLLSRSQQRVRKSTASTLGRRASLSTQIHSDGSIAPFCEPIKVRTATCHWMRSGCQTACNGGHNRCSPVQPQREFLLIRRQRVCTSGANETTDLRVSTDFGAMLRPCSVVLLSA
jgi:hypothetical protein